jgi:hypothetical protein
VLILIGLAMTSCNPEKKIKRSLNKNGVRETATYIAKNYPEYFKRDTIRLRDTIKEKVPVYIPAIEKDSSAKADTAKCKELFYSDKHLTFAYNTDSNGIGKTHYKIHDRTITKEVKVPVYIEVPGNVGPTMAIIDQLKEEKDQKEGELALIKSQMKNAGSFYKHVCLLLLIAVVIAILYAVARERFKRG